MTKFLRVLAACCACVLTVGPLGMATAGAQSPASASTGSIIGVAQDAQGAPLAGVTVTISGPVNQSQTTGQDGAYAFNAIPPGLYQVLASKGGYDSARQTDLPVLGGSQQVLNPILVAATLTSLREIGRQTVNSGARSRFNAGPASIQTLSNQSFVDQQQPQVQRLLDQTPGIVIDHPGTNANNASPGAITFPSIRGGLGFETASLIDGHPLAVGAFGDYVTTFLNSYVLQGVEVIKGPGAGAPQVNFAINGTVNFRTLEPTRKPTSQAVFGVDSYGGSFSNFRYTGTTTNGKLGWAFDYAVDGSPGPTSAAGSPGYIDVGNQGGASSAAGVGVYINGNAVTAGQTSAGTANPNIRNYPTVANTTLLGCCFNAVETYTSHTELAKLRYNISPVTQVTASYLGSQTWTDQNGNHLYQYVQNFAPGATYPTGGVNGIIPTGPTPIWYFSYNPYPVTEWEINNEPIFQGEIRTTFHNDIVLGRYYAASINRLQYNSLQNQFQSASFPLQLFGTVTTTAGTQTFTGQTANITLTPSTATTSQYCKTAQGYWITCPAGATPLDVNNGPYFRSMEEDKLHGGSFEYDHFLGTGGDTISLAYDNVKMQTNAYGTGALLEFPNSIPAGSYEQFQTILLRGIFNVTDKFNVTLANYLNLYHEHYTPNKAITADQANPASPTYLNIPGLIVGSANPFATYVDQQYTHYDGRLGLTYRYSPGLSLRASAGSAIAPPYLNLLSAANTAPAQTGICANLSCYSNTINAGQTLRPETSFGYDLGADARISSDGLTLLTFDAYRNNLFNQFLSSVATTGGYNGTAQCALGSSPSCLPLFSSYNVNLSNARYEGVEAAITRDPALGFGFIAQGALIHAYPYNISPCFYSQNVVNGVQNCTGTPNANLGVVPGINYNNSGNSGVSTYNEVSNHAEPYSQGYGEIHYRFRNNGYLSLGMQYYGNNNSLNVPAFFIGNATARFPLFGDARTQLAFSVDNMFNTYGQAYSTAWGGACVPLVNGQCGLTNAYSIGPRNLRISISRNFGNPIR